MWGLMKNDYLPEHYGNIKDKEDAKSKAFAISDPKKKKLYKATNIW